MQQQRRIRPPRRTVGVSRDQSDFDQCWELLKAALRDIHMRDASKLSFEQLYRASYKIVVNKRGGELNQLVHSFEEQWFADHVIPEISKLITPNIIQIATDAAQGSTSQNERRMMSEVFLRGIRKSWEDHAFSMSMVADILMYLDRGFETSPGQVSIYTTTINLFRDHILRKGAGQDDVLVFDVLSSVILDLINEERNGEVIDKSVIKSCVGMMETLYDNDPTRDERPEDRLYIGYFHPLFLVRSRDFYAAECVRMLNARDTHAWLHSTRRRLEEEYARCNSTLSPYTHAGVKAIIQEELVIAHLAEFLAFEGTGLKAMLENETEEDLAILYSLTSEVSSGKNILKNSLGQQIIDEGLEIQESLKNSVAEPPADGEEKGKAQPLSAATQATAAAVAWVENVLQLKNKYDRLWSRCFQEDLELQTALTASFTRLFRLCAQSPEYVSLYVDDMFRRGVNGKTDAEVDTMLDRALVMIEHIGSKDSFEKYYQKHLSRRLLHKKTVSKDAELMLIGRMQQKLGKTFTKSFEGMFKDVTTSEELTRTYSDRVKGLGEAEADKIDLVVQVLNGINWPNEVASSAQAEEVSCVYPPEIQRIQTSFGAFYLGPRTGRRLNWVGSAGSADMKCVFPKIPGHDKGPLSRERKYELNVSTYAMVVLLLFNDLPEGGSLTLEEIQGKTNIPKSELQRAIAAVSLPPKSRVLLKEPASKTVKMGDKFTFNAQFQSKMTRIKAPIVSAMAVAEDNEQRKDTEQMLMQSRGLTIEAAVVRIMKQRRKMKHNELVAETISQIKHLFQPDVSFVKQKIEILIDKDYLERIDDSFYQYLA